MSAGRARGSGAGRGGSGTSWRRRWGRRTPALHLLGPLGEGGGVRRQPPSPPGSSGGAAAAAARGGPRGAGWQQGVAAGWEAPAGSPVGVCAHCGVCPAVGGGLVVCFPFPRCFKALAVTEGICAVMSLGNWLPITNYSLARPPGLCQRTPASIKDLFFFFLFRQELRIIAFFVPWTLHVELPQPVSLSENRI